MEISEDQVILNAMRTLGLLRSGEIPNQSDKQHVGMELQALIGSLHLLLAQRIAVHFKVERYGFTIEEKK